MAEKIVSPGVFTTEIDASFLPSAVGEIGAAIIGPTIKGVANVPQVVESFQEFKHKYGTMFQSGSTQIQYLTSIAADNYLRNASALTVVRILDGEISEATASVLSSVTPAGTVNQFESSSFRLHTHAEGAIMNNYGPKGQSATGSNASLQSGSANNIRWNISSRNTSRGTFDLQIRQGDDTNKNLTVLETWKGLNLDNTSPDFIAKRIGDSKQMYKEDSDGNAYVYYSGSFPNKSNFVWVETNDIMVTPNYLGDNGTVNDSTTTGESYSSSIPPLGSGSLAGAFGGGLNGAAGFDGLGNYSGSNAQTKCTFYGSAGAANTQCFSPSDTTTQDGGRSYYRAIKLLANKDEYDINLLLLPGLTQKHHGTHIKQAIDACEDRGDCMVVVDPVPFESSLTDATGEAGDYDSNYVAMYWPWIQVPEGETGMNRWVPPSCVMGGIYAFNDTVAHPWFAPAGLNRGGIDMAIQAEQKLTHSNRDDLYEAGVNPIATFPGQGVCVWGQKTLQKKPSALDRINVRRLLIKVKKFIASSSRFLVFEQNNEATRKRFLNMANPFLEQVQSQSGLNAFKVVMDDTNNTPDQVDRNILYGQLFLQPTRTAEFIVLDFTVQPTGATFPE
jgi:hypothetical protein